jgi:hypothetical protein
MKGEKDMLLHIQHLKLWIENFEDRLKDNNTMGVYIFSGDILHTAKLLDATVLKSQKIRKS